MYFVSFPIFIRKHTTLIMPIKVHCHLTHLLIIPSHYLHWELIPFRAQWKRKNTAQGWSYTRKILTLTGLILIFTSQLGFIHIRMPNHLLFLTPFHTQYLKLCLTIYLTCHKLVSPLKPNMAGEQLSLVCEVLGFSLSLKQIILTVNVLKFFSVPLDKFWDSTFN
jgi:hypothetical protein